MEKETAFLMWEREDDYEIYGALISPGVGIKLGFGKPRGFVLTATLDYDIVLGEKTYLYYYGEKDNGAFGVGFKLNAKVLFGFAF